jgi:hypothetical protein
MQWIIETAKFLLESSDVPIVIRQHPAERLQRARSSDDYRRMLQERLPANPRLHFISAEDNINSYALLERASAVAVYTSTFGIEAAANGKPVITASRSYYSDLGFVWRAHSLEEYHQHLLGAVSGGRVVTDAMRSDALACYYITQCCNWTHSPFTPENFPAWSRMSVSDLLQHEKVRLTIRSLSQDVPIAFLNHLANLGQQMGRT